MYASKGEEQPPQHLKIRLLLSGFSKTTVKDTILLFGHNEISSLAKAAL
jgi:hypothetical protein